MFKQAMIGLFTISVVAICWNNANAGCLQYRIVGGSNMCVKWSTAGVKCEVQINGQNCEGEGCTVTCSTDPTNNNIAFCQSLSGTVRRTCPTTTFLTYGPTSESPSCTTGNDNDGDDNDEGGSGQHCTASITLTNPDCSSCCNTGETCVDVTPANMHATAEVSVDESSDFFLEADCTIDPKKIQLNQSRPYNCTIPPPD